MAINRQVLSTLLNEHCYRPITGRYLNVGKQTVSVNPETLRSLFDKYGLDRSHLDKLLDKEVHDQVTRWAHEFGIVGMADHDLLACFSDAEYLCANRLRSYSKGPRLRNLRGTVDRRNLLYRRSGRVSGVGR